MSEYKPVTSGQMECGRKIANEKQIGRIRWQRALDSGSFGRYLDSLTLGPEDIKLPTSARVHILKINVEQGSKWQSAVDGIGCGNDTRVLELARLYPPFGKKLVEEVLVLINFPTYGDNWDKAVIWADANRLIRTDPREVFAVGMKYPKLKDKLNQGARQIRLVATNDGYTWGCSLACHVRFEDGLPCTAGIDATSQFNVPNEWFAFRW